MHKKCAVSNTPRTGKASAVDLRMDEEPDGSGYSGSGGSGYRRKKAAVMLPIDAVEAGVVEAGVAGNAGAA